MSQQTLAHILQPITKTHTHLGLGPLDVYVEHDAHDWRLAFNRTPTEQDRWNRDAETLEADARNSLSWKRFAYENDSKHLKLSFRFPRRPIVIRPDAPYLISPNEKIQFFMSVPITLRVTADAPEAPILVEETTSILSNTWFGDPTSGELCFASRTRAKRNIDELDQRRYRIICPVRLRNNSDEVLVFERVCLRVQFLRMYAGLNHLWSNEVGITYRGKDEISRVAYHPRGPSFDPQASLLTEADDDNPHQFNMRSFYSGVLNL